MGDISTLFVGTAAVDTGVAADLILEAGDDYALTMELTDVGTRLGDEDLSSAISAYVEARTRGDSHQLRELKQAVATLVRRLPSQLWRNATQASTSKRDQQMSHLHHVAGLLRKITSSMAFLVDKDGEGKRELLMILGALQTFIGEADDKEDMEIAGMFATAGEILQSSAVQTFAQKAKVALPTTAKSVSAKRPTPVPVPARTRIPTPAPEPPAKPARQLAPFDYHPSAGQKLENERYLESYLDKLKNRIETEVPEWPYDFVRWVRSLYLWAGELPEEPDRIKDNINRGVRRLNDLPTIEVSDIRQILGPPSLTLGKSLTGIPEDWPRDFPNDTGASLITLWDKGEIASGSEDKRLRDVVLLIADYWTKSGQHPNKDTLRGELKFVIRILEWAIQKGGVIDYVQIANKLGTTRRKLAPETPQPSGPVAVPPPATPATEPISQSEWITRAIAFLAHERKKWGGDYQSPMVQIIDRSFARLSGENFSTPKALQLLTLLFHLTLNLRKMLGVVGEAALALGTDTGVPQSFSDRAPSYEAEMRSRSQPDLLQEWADGVNGDSRAYPPLLGETGLPELVGRYIEYLRGGNPDPMTPAVQNFIAGHPELKLTEPMVRSVLAYFLGIVDGEFNIDLFRETVREVPAEDVAPPPVLDIEQLRADPVFHDMDPDRITPYGLIFVRVCLSQRPGLTGRSDVFMIFVRYLERIYRVYRESVRKGEGATFDGAYESAMAKSKAKDQFRETYRKLFGNLLQFLSQQQHLADFVERQTLAGETEIDVPRKREGIRAAGGPPVPAPVEPVLEPLLEPVRAEPVEALIGPSTSSGQTEVEPPIVLEEVFDQPATVTPSGGVAVDEVNPFVAVGEPLPPEAPSPYPLPQEGERGGITLPPPPPAVRVSTPPPAPARVELPPEIEALAANWNLERTHRLALKDMLEASDIPTVLDVLKILYEKEQSPERKKGWLIDYHTASALGRLTARAKRQLLEKMRSQETSGRVIYLLPIAAVRATELFLDQIMPEPTQLGRKFGRHTAIVRHGKPRLILRPAVTWDEGLYHEERAVQPSGAAVLAYIKPGVVIDIGIKDGHFVGEETLVHMIGKSIGALASGKRNGLTLVVVAKGVTERARRFLFSLIPNATLILWQGSEFSIHRFEKGEGGRVDSEAIKHYSRNGRLTTDDKQALSPKEGDLAIKNYGETDWNEQTRSQILELTNPLIELAEKEGLQTLATAIKTARSRVIRTVGFLHPDHPDVQRVLEICFQFRMKTIDLQILRGLLQEWNGAIQEMEERFHPPGEVVQPKPSPEPRHTNALNHAHELTFGDTQFVAVAVGERGKFLWEQIRPNILQERYDTLIERLWLYHHRKGNVKRLLADLQTIYDKSPEGATAVINDLTDPAKKEWGGDLLKTIGGLATLAETMGVDPVALLERLERNWGIDQSEAMKKLSAIILPTDSRIPAPKNLGAWFKRMLAGETADAQVQVVLDLIERLRPMGYLIADVAHVEPVSQPVRLITTTAGVRKGVTVDPRQTAVALKGIVLQDGALLSYFQRKDNFDFTGVSDGALNTIWLASQLKKKVVVVVQSPAGITTRSLRLFFRLNPQGEMIWFNSSYEMQIYRRDGNNVMLGNQVATTLDQKDDDIVIEGMTAPKKQKWEPRSVGWQGLFTKEGIPPEAVWVPIREILPTLSGLEGPLSYQSLQTPLERLADRVREQIGHLENARGSVPFASGFFPLGQKEEWLDKLGTLELQILEAFSESDTAVEGIGKILLLAEIVVEVKDIQREIIMTELVGCQKTLEKLEKDAGHKFPDFLRAEKEKLPVWIGRVDNETLPLGSEFFEQLDRLRSIFLGASGFINAHLRQEEAGHHQFHSRRDLELPPDSAGPRELREFLERYGFRFVRRSNRYDVFRHAASGVSQKIPREADESGGHLWRNYYWYTVRAAETALRATGQMAPVE